MPKSGKSLECQLLSRGTIYQEWHQTHTFMNTCTHAHSPLTITYTNIDESTIKAKKTNNTYNKAKVAAVIMDDRVSHMRFHTMLSGSVCTWNHFPKTKLEPFCVKWFQRNCSHSVSNYSKHIHGAFGQVPFITNTTLRYGLYQGSSPHTLCTGYSQTTRRPTYGFLLQPNLSPTAWAPFHCHMLWCYRMPFITLQTFNSWNWTVKAYTQHSL